MNDTSVLRMVHNARGLRSMSCGRSAQHLDWLNPAQRRIFFPGCRTKKRPAFSRRLHTFKCLQPIENCIAVSGSSCYKPAPRCGGRWAGPGGGRSEPSSDCPPSTYRKRLCRLGLALLRAGPGRLVPGPVLRRSQRRAREGKLSEVSMQTYFADRRRRF